MYQGLSDKETQTDTGVKIYWRCEYLQCKGRVTTINNDLVEEAAQTMHALNKQEAEVMMSMARLKKAAATSQDALSQLLNKELQVSLPTSGPPCVWNQANNVTVWEKFGVVRGWCIFYSSVVGTHEKWHKFFNKNKQEAEVKMFMARLKEAAATSQAALSRLLNKELQVSLLTSGPPCVWNQANNVTVWEKFGVVRGWCVFYSSIVGRHEKWHKVFDEKMPRAEYCLPKLYHDMRFCIEMCYEYELG